MAEPQIVIENREELNFLLSQTPWLEHMVMLAYLFAAFSFKTEWIDLRAIRYLQVEDVAG